jgi:excisionase family DNA binding protein
VAFQVPTLDEIREAMRQVVREELAVLGPDVMTVEQAARFVGREPSTIRGWLLQGLLATKKGRRVYIRREDLASWMARPERSTEAIVASLRRSG